MIIDMEDKVALIVSSAMQLLESESDGNSDDEAFILDVRELYIRKTADLPLQLCVDTFPRFVAIGFYFLSETLI
jgi:isocitrate dehydrogenase kinase/phosphatase